MFRPLSTLYEIVADLLDDLFTMQGRLSRLQLFYRLIGLAVAMLFLILIIGMLNGQAAISPVQQATSIARIQVALTLFAGFWVLVASIVKRLHDIGRSGRYGFIGLILLPLLLLLPGERHMNRFGIPPVSGTGKSR